MFTNSSSGVTNKASDIWDDQESDEKLWNLRSGFDKLYLTGYRNAILGDFEEEEAAGRIEGFETAFQSQSKVNPTIYLSRLDGLLMACLTKCKSNLNEEQKVEIRLIQNMINHALKLNFEPSKSILEKVLKSNKQTETRNEQEEVRLCSSECFVDAKYSEDSTRDRYKSRDSKCGCTPGQTDNAETCLNEILSRTRAVCDSVGWKIPDFILNHEL